MTFAQHRAVELLARDIFEADPPSNPHGLAGAHGSSLASERLAGQDSGLEFGGSSVKTEAERARRIAAHLIERGYGLLPMREGWFLRGSFDAFPWLLVETSEDGSLERPSGSVAGSVLAQIPEHLGGPFRASDGHTSVAVADGGAVRELIASRAALEPRETPVHPEAAAVAALNAAGSDCYAIAVAVYSGPPHWTRRKVYLSSSGNAWLPLHPDDNCREPREVPSGAVVNDTIGFRAVDPDSPDGIQGGIVNVVNLSDVQVHPVSSSVIQDAAHGTILRLGGDFEAYVDDLLVIRNGANYEVVSADIDEDGLTISPDHLVNSSSVAQILHDPASEAHAQLITQPYVQGA